MILNDKIYNVLKWLCLVCLPAVQVFVTAIFGVYNIPYAEQVTSTISAVALLIGSLIGISQMTYSIENQDIKKLGDGDEKK